MALAARASIEAVWRNSSMSAALGANIAIADMKARFKGNCSARRLFRAAL